MDSRKNLYTLCSNTPFLQTGVERISKGQRFSKSTTPHHLDQQLIQHRVLPKLRRCAFIHISVNHAVLEARCNSSVVREAAKFRSAENRINREEFLKRMERVIFADSPEQGIVRNNAFYHASLGLALQFPAGWKVSNSPQNVTAVNNERTALVDLRSAGAAEGSPTEVLRRILKLGNGSSVTPTTIGGFKAAFTEQAISGKPTRVAVIFHGKSAYAIALQANTDAVYRQNLPAMEAAMQSFHAITDKERELAKPLRIRVITARAGLTFAELAKTSPLGRFAEGHLRVINGLYPAGEPAAGETLKIIE